MGTKNVLTAALSMKQKPWVIYGSSREVYGHPQSLPVPEDAPLAPVNIYGRSKAASEVLVNEARTKSLTTAIVRFSNVYGSTSDHSDRVIPAFSRAASRCESLRVDGPGHVFDFNHLEDTVRGLVSLVDILEQGVNDLPPIHFVTGVPTTLGELARMAIELAQSSSTTVLSIPRSYDVARFIGNPSRAQDLLGWTPRIGIRDGLERLIQDFRDLDNQINQQGITA
jgi:nucleoside-diphosphate-sugar epimerase